MSRKEHYLLKLEPSLMNRLRTQAADENRSIVSIIVEALLQYYRRKDAQDRELSEVRDAHRI